MKQTLMNKIINVLTKEDARIGEAIHLIVAEKGIYIKNVLNEKNVLITLGMNEEKILEEYQNIL